jgi:hypothetical protein
MHSTGYRQQWTQPPPKGDAGTRSIMRISSVSSSQSKENRLGSHHGGRLEGSPGSKFRDLRSVGEQSLVNQGLTRKPAQPAKWGEPSLSLCRGARNGSWKPLPWEQPNTKRRRRLLGTQLSVRQPNLSNSAIKSPHYLKPVCLELKRK